MTTMTTETGVTRPRSTRCSSRRRPQAIWDAITTPEWTERYGYAGPRRSTTCARAARYRGVRQRPRCAPWACAETAHRRRGHRGRPAAPARSDLALPLGSEQIAAEGHHAPHLGDRRGARRRLAAHGDPRARERPEHGEHGRRRRSPRPAAGGAGSSATSRRCWRPARRCPADRPRARAAPAPPAPARRSRAGSPPRSRTHERPASRASRGTTDELRGWDSNPQPFD